MKRKYLLFEIVYLGYNMFRYSSSKRLCRHRKCAVGTKSEFNSRSYLSYIKDRGSSIRNNDKDRVTIYRPRTRNIKPIKSIFQAMAIISGFFVTTLLMAFILTGIYIKNLSHSLPDPNMLVDWVPDQATTIYDRNGNELYTIYADENRKFIPLEEVPEHTKWAILAAEDIDFYEHKGLDFRGMIRASYMNIKADDGSIQGASTITQQLVKNTLMFSVYKDKAFERTYTRKIREALLAMRVEQTMTKDELLQMYINEFPCGGVNYGLEACSKAYFNKSAKDLTLEESAMLAGVIASPSVYSPIYGSKPELGKERQKHVLDLMLEYEEDTGVTAEQVDKAMAHELDYTPKKQDIPAPHFVFYIKDKLIEKYGREVVEKGGLQVYTTIDLNTQKVLEEEIRGGVKRYGHRYGVYNGAGVILDPNTNQILAMLGSVDYNNSKDPRIDGNVNVTTSLRQMGSSVKPYTYLAAFERGYGPWLETPDVSYHDFGAYEPVNWDEKYYGKMVAREALVQSRNIPAVYTMKKIGVDSFIDTAEKMGITTLGDRSRYGLSITLGAAEMKLIEHAQGFSVFATGGIKRDVTGILKVTDSNGTVLEEYQKNKGEHPFDKRSIYMVNWTLCDLGGFGDQPFSRQYYSINGKRQLCGKTGTTNGPRDLVAVQYHKNLVVAIWAGNNDNTETPGAWSTTVPLPISHRVMSRLAEKYPPKLYSPPAGIKYTYVCNDTGMIPRTYTVCRKVRTIYADGHPPPLGTWVPKPKPKEELKKESEDPDESV